MKFKSIELKNFMRYKGVNKIEFSCDEKKNVTVILGDNTVGKTTIAQAFRWCLYGAIMAERGKKQEDYQLLNNNILEMMDADSKASVSVEIIARDESKYYIIKREISYTRAVPKLIAKEFNKKLSVKITENLEFGDVIEVDENKTEALINELFPKNLSHYFLFDGERWNDVTVNGVRENIKESVHILTGLSAYQAAMNHLKDMGTYSVISKFKKEIKGTGNIYDSLEEDLRRCEREINKCQEKIKINNVNISNNTKEIEKIEEYLETNKDTEVLQSRYKQLKVIKRNQWERYLANYTLLVNGFSDKAYMTFARPLIEASVEMVKGVAGERRDIPHMRQASIDYILKTGKCICGTVIRENSKELECLLEQRNYLPPADIGSLLGEFEKTANRWKNKSRDLMEELEPLAVKIGESRKEFEDTSMQIVQVEKTMDEHIDFAKKRLELQECRNEVLKLERENGGLIGQIESYKKQMTTIEHNMQMQEVRSEENAKWRKRVEIAESVYNRMKKDFGQKEQQIFLELNQQIQENFQRMFNAKDKQIQLSKQYEIQMFYKTAMGLQEERNLSEGEKIARNFAFIVTIMEYSRKRKQEQKQQMLGLMENHAEEPENDTLPIVLDGPFSKLGDENIGLIAKVLPEVAEQVIIFMLKKDWKYTGLDEYIGAEYAIDKAAEQSYASIQRVKGGE